MNPTTRRTLEDLQSNFARVAASYRSLIAIAREARSFPFDACPVRLRPFRHLAYDPAPTFASLARRTAGEVVDVVGRALAGDHALVLDGHEAVVAGFFEEGDSALPIEAFCCVRLGQALHDAYADRAPAMVLRQTADRVAELFGLFVGIEPAVRRGCVVLTVRMHADRWGGRLSYSNDRDLVEACQSLADAVFAINPATGTQMQQDVQQLVRIGRDRQWAPERMAYGPLGPVALRAYQNKVEFLVPVNLAPGINAFLTEHAARLRTPDRVTA